MQWIQIILFLLIVNGLFTLFAVRFNDFFHVLSQSQKTTLQDDVDALLGKPGGRGGSRLSKGYPSSCLPWEL